MARRGDGGMRRTDYPLHLTDVIEDRSIRRGDYVKRYKLGKYLGKGGFAKCYEMTSFDSKRVYAGKIIPKASLSKSSARQKLLNEIKIHRSLAHRNVVKFERFFEDKNNVYILLELCHNHTLMELLKRRKRLTEPEVRYYMWQLLNTVEYLHKECVIHRDLKLGNLFLYKDMEIKVGDFGLAARLDHPDERKKTICGTPNYIAPEILDSRNTSGHSFEVDVWGIGVIMYTLLIGSPPFETSSVKSTYKRIRANSYCFPVHINISKAAKEMIVSILHSNPAKRPSIPTMKAHTFFSQAAIPAFLPSSCLTVPLDFTNNNENMKHGQNPLMPKIASHQVLKHQPLQERKQVLGERHINRMGSNQENLINPKSAGGLALPAPLTNHKATNKPVVFNAMSAKSINTVVKPSTNAVPTTRMTLTRSRSIGLKQSTQQQATATGRARVHTRRSSEREMNRNKENDPAPMRPVLTRSRTSPVGGNSDMGPPAAVPIHSSALQLRSGSNAAPMTGSCPSVSPTGRSTSPTGSVPRNRSGGSSASHSQKQKHSELAGPADVRDEKMELATEDIANLGGARSAPKGAKNSDNGPVGPVDEEEEGVFREMHDEIEKSFRVQPKEKEQTTRRLRSSEKNKKLVEGADLWVNKWVDYSNKYGLGYLLSNGNSGVYFNDSSKAILHADKNHFEYISRRSASTGRGGERTQHTLKSYPPTLQKKVTLLKHFMNYLVSHKKTTDDENKENSGSNKSSDMHDDSDLALSKLPEGALYRNNDMVYVKKWIRTKHAILFRLSNRTVQVIFYDHTEIVLSSEDRTVTYTNKRKERNTYPLDTVFTNPRPDLAKRMKYTKDILFHLLSRSHHPRVATNPSDSKPTR